MIGVLLLATGSPVAAQKDKSGSLSPDEAHDRRVHAALYKVTLEGVEMFNSGRHTAAAHYFQAAATSLAPFLDHRRELQEGLQKALADAEEEPNAVRRARILHAALLSASNNTLEPMIIIPRPDKDTTLWERLGGEKGVTRIINDFVDAALRNREVNFTRNNAFLQTDEQVKKLKRQLVELTSALGKGPYKYPGRSMREIHKDMSITDAEFEALRMDLHFALSSNGVKATDVIFILAGYDSTRPDIVTVHSKRPKKNPPRVQATLWDKLGGEEGVTKTMGDLVDLLVKDKRVNLSRNGKYLKRPAEIAALKRQFVALASAAGKGKEQYEGKTMLDAHKGMGITDDEFDAFVEDLEKALLKNNVEPEAILVVKRLVEDKRTDIVEKPRKNVGPVKKTKPAATSGQTDSRRSGDLGGRSGGAKKEAERVGGSPVEVILVLFEVSSVVFNFPISLYGAACAIGGMGRK
jgi:hemoglobin